VTRRSIALALLCAARAGGEAAPEAEARVAHLRTALEALEKTDEAVRRGVERAVRARAEGVCASDIPRLRVDCLAAAAGPICRGEGGRCPALVDLVAAVVLAEERLVPERERLQLVAGASGRTLSDALRRAAAALALDFRLRSLAAGSPAQLPTEIDRYCLRTAHETRLPWQACAAALVWFIGNHP
jgi:hypothetical protein